MDLRVSASSFSSFAPRSWTWAVMLGPSTTGKERPSSIWTTVSQKRKGDGKEKGKGTGSGLALDLKTEYFFSVGTHGVGSSFSLCLPIFFKINPRFSFRIGRSGDPQIRRSGDWEIGRSGDREIGRSGDREIGIFSLLYQKSGDLP